jgi:hypothetical protein
MRAVDAVGGKAVALDRRAAREERLLAGLLSTIDPRRVPGPLDPGAPPGKKWSCLRSARVFVPAGAAGRAVNTDFGSMRADVVSFVFGSAIRVMPETRTSSKNRLTTS